MLGRETKSCGLGESLLGRLLREYRSLGEVMKSYHVSLTFNYRSHPGIVSLLQPLFYPNTQLRCQHSQPVEFPYKSCLLFSCSSIRDEKVKVGVNQKEAEIVSHTLQELLSERSEMISSVGIMAKYRNQVD